MYTGACTIVINESDIVTHARLILTYRMSAHMYVCPIICLRTHTYTIQYGVVL